MAKNQAEIEFIAKDKVSKVLDKVNKKLKSSAKETKNVGKTLKDLKLSTVAYVAAATKLLQIMGRSIEAYKQQVFAEARLERALKTQKTFTDQNFESLKNLAAQLQRVTIFSDEQTISAMAMLSSFKLNAVQIGKMTPLLQDLSTMTMKTTGQQADLESMAKLVGLALEGQAGRMKQAGISLTNLQVAMIDASDRGEKFNVLTQVIEQNAGGLAEAVGETGVAAFEKFKNEVGDLTEELGKFVAVGLQDTVEEVNEIIRALINLSSHVKLAGEETEGFRFKLEHLIPITGQTKLVWELLTEVARRYNKRVEETKRVQLEAVESTETLDDKFDVFKQAIEDNKDSLSAWRDELKGVNEDLKDLKDTMFVGEGQIKSQIIEQKLLINQLKRQRDSVRDNEKVTDEFNSKIKIARDELEKLRTKAEEFSLQREKATFEIEMQNKGNDDLLKNYEDLKNRMKPLIARQDELKESIREVEESNRILLKSQKQIMDIAGEMGKSFEGTKDKFNEYLENLEQKLPTERDQMQQRVEEAERLRKEWEGIRTAQAAFSAGIAEGGSVTT